MTIELKAAVRQIEGKKVKELRRKGSTPAHLFGPGVKSESIQVETPVLKRVLAEAGRTRLVSLRIGSDPAPRTVMVREIQMDNLKDEVLHVDFYQVNMAVTIKVEVPLVLVGESAAARAKGNALVQELTNLSIDCLPGNIPNSIAVDVSPIATADQMIRVRDIQVPAGVTVLNDQGIVVARIAVEQVEKEEEKPAVEAAAEGAAAAEASAEGAPAAEKKEPAGKAARKG